MSKLSEFLLTLPVKIEPDESKRIVSFTKDSGFPCAMYVDGNRKYIWRSHVFRSLNRDRVPSEVVEEAKKAWRSLDFALRDRLDLEWTWDTSEKSKEATATVRRIVERLSPYIRKLGRVQVLLQRPALGVPFHTDLMPGSSYDGVLYKPISSLDIESTELHEKNRYLAIKVPLTELDGDNGYPAVEIDGDTYVYDVGSNAFVIDEYRIRHGSLPCGHWRGVLVIDAELDVERIMADAKGVSAAPRRFDKVFRRVMSVRRSDLTAMFPGQPDDGLDIQLIVSDYTVMRLKSPNFLGACIKLSGDGLTLTGNTYWAGEQEQNAFYLQNEAFIREMATIFNVLSAQRGIAISRRGEWVDVTELPSQDQKAIHERGFVRFKESGN